MATVADIMERDPVTQLIAEHKHNRLRAVDGEGRVVGVVTRLDVLDALTKG